MKKYFVSYGIVLLLFTVTLPGQDKGFSASAPATVEAGQQFQYVIEVMDWHKTTIKF